MASDILSTLATHAGRLLSEQGLMVATAESCTGGWVAAAMTAVPGSSGWFERGFVTYSNAAKQESLGVAAATLEREGAVSEAVAREMAQGALRHSHAHTAVAITGIAGPTGGSPGKPVGTVCIAWAGPASRIESVTHRFQGDRDEVRRQSVRSALQGLIERLAP
jgi:nicotinamide-nucleotide amidase